MDESAIRKRKGEESNSSMRLIWDGTYAEGLVYGCCVVGIVGSVGIVGETSGLLSSRLESCGAEGRGSASSDAMHGACVVWCGRVAGS